MYSARQKIYDDQNDMAEAMYAAEELSKLELQRHVPCRSCNSNFPKSIAEKIKASKSTSSIPLSDTNDTPRYIVPKESEKIVFSRKYNPDLRSENDGFVPVPGPYGRKRRPIRDDVLKTPASNTYKSISESRYRNGPPRLSKNHYQRHAQDINYPQRRSQYRRPKIHEDLTVKESIANENILGNGNFEIIKGGIYSDQDANEILGSRRVSRGYNSYGVPTFPQTRYRTQNIQFPPFHRRQNQNPLNPLFFQRASY